MVLKTCSRCGRGDDRSPCRTCRGYIRRQRERERTQYRGTTTERGLGYAHRQQAAAQLEAQPWCGCCGSELELQADHVVARARGGRSVAGNYGTLCAPCNASKGDGPRCRLRHAR